MLPKIDPTGTPSWKLLASHAEEMKTLHLRDLFAGDPDRFKKFAFCLNDMVTDMSKNLVTERTWKLLVQLANDCKLPDAIRSMFAGDLINETERRAVLHVALRNFSGDPVHAEGKNVMDDILRVRRQMESFCNSIHSGEKMGFTGKPFRYIVNIGIGGSDLGPYMVTEALKPYWK